MDFPFIYCWWTVSAGYDRSMDLRWLKLGPVTFASFRWFFGISRFEIHLLNRLVLEF
jgi:hypothetical protein